ncbi:MAG: LysE family transporter [Flavobacteriales bacterium]|nr:LysE family transporter [Flavobacteriales bacterium]
MNSFLFPFIAGIATGVVLGFGFGTVFFALIQNSINFGYRKGVDIALGVVLSDIFIVSIILFGSQYLDEIEKYKDVIKYTGGFLLIGLGIYQFFPQKKIVGQDGEIIVKGRFLFITKGFLLNFMNPVNFLAWLAIQTYLKGVSGYTTNQSMYFFMGAIGAIFLIELLISLLANYIGRKLSDKIIRIVNVTSGYIFIILGIVLIFKKI